MKTSVLLAFIAATTSAFCLPPAGALERTPEQQSAAAGVRFAEGDPGDSAPAEPVAATRTEQAPDFRGLRLGASQPTASAESSKKEVPLPEEAKGGRQIDGGAILFGAGAALTLAGFLLMQPALVKIGLAAAAAVVVIGAHSESKSR